MAKRSDDDSLFDADGGAAPRAPRQASLLFGIEPKSGKRPTAAEVAYEKGHRPTPSLKPVPPAPAPPPPLPAPSLPVADESEPRWRIRRRDAEQHLATDAQVRWGDAWRGMLRAEQWVLDFADGEALRLRRSVRTLALHEGVVESSVVDGRGKPHRAQLRLAAFPASDWARLARVVVESGGRSVVSESARTKGVALALVEAADACTLAFLPRRLVLVPATCTCGGARIPCDHVIATHLALAKSFDDDPWTLLKLRGATPEHLDEWMARAEEMVDAHASDQGPGAAGANDWGFEPASIDWSGLQLRRPRRAPWAPPDGWKGRESFDALVRRLVERAGGLT